PSVTLLPCIRSSPPISLLSTLSLHDALPILFELAQDRRGVAASHDDIGRLLWLRGDYDAALKELRVALDMRKELGDRRSIALSLDRKSTRLNSSHVKISYAVFCLKKKKKKEQ